MGLATGTVATVAGVILLYLGFFWAPAACGQAIPTGVELEFLGLAVIAFGLAVGLYVLYVPGMVTIMAMGGTLFVAGLVVAATLAGYCVGVAP